MAKDTREILRTVNVNGELYEPGMEDELEDALAGVEEADEDEQFSAKDELQRLTNKGYVVGFGAEPDEEELEGGTPDQIATRARRRAIVQEAAEKPKARGKGARGKSGKVRQPKIMPQNPENTGTSSAPTGENEGANEEE